jgi:hypothetical protein
MQFGIVRTGVLSCLLLASTAGNAWATLLMYDGFDYAAASDVTGQSGGTGSWVGNAWSTGASVVTATIGSPGLTYGTGLGTLTVAGNLADSTVAGTTASINFRSTGLINSGDVWISYLAKAENAAALAQFFGLGTYNGGTVAANSVLTIQKLGDGSNEWGLVGNLASLSADDSTDIVVTPGQTYLLVTQLSFSGGGDTANMYVNPALDANPPALPDAVVTGPSGSLTFDRIRVASAQSLDWQFDEIRIGTAFSDVVPFVAVPEASAIGFGCVALVCGVIGHLRRARCEPN